jgi:hypothetical protein
MENPRHAMAMTRPTPGSSSSSGGSRSERRRNVRSQAVGPVEGPRMYRRARRTGPEGSSRCGPGQGRGGPAGTQHAAQFGGDSLGVGAMVIGEPPQDGIELAGEHLRGAVAPAVVVLEEADCSCLLLSLAAACLRWSLSTRRSPWGEILASARPAWFSPASLDPEPVGVDGQHVGVGIGDLVGGKHAQEQMLAVHVNHPGVISDCVVRSGERTVTSPSRAWCLGLSRPAS